MTARAMARAAGWVWMAAWVAVVGRAVAAPREARLPNVVLVFCDDLGWGDLGCQGATGIRTPHLDGMARDGTRFRRFYVAQAVCSASRAALLTGCYPNRVGIHGALGPRQTVGLHPDETTLAEVLKGRGYATGMVGKWHLGRPARFLPTRQGFDEYLGLPYSNDMWPSHPTAPRNTYPPLPLIEGDTVIEEQPDQSGLTRRYTERAVDFIRRNASRPFFLYVAHSMPHVPIFAGKGFRGRSARGTFGDVVEEIDASVGAILGELRRQRLEEDTLVIFTSDNGPWLSYGNHAGSAGPFREGKGTSFEGGIRVPCLVRWPGRVPAGRVSDEPWMTIDVLPTVSALVGAPAPARKIDGKNVWPLIEGRPGATNPHAAYLVYYNVGELQAVMAGPWKLFLPHRSQTLGGMPGGTNGTPAPYRPMRVGLELYHLGRDPGETTDVAGANPGVVRDLLLHAEAAREELGDGLTRRVGSGVRAAGKVESGP